MGLFSWLFPSDNDRIAKAQRMLADERWADARLEVLDMHRPEARAIVDAAESELARVNLDAAVSWAEAGDDYRVMVHMDLAEEFHSGGLEAEFRAARRRLRELRAERSAEERRKHEEREARLLSVDPFGISGGPNLFRPALPEGIDGEDAVELAARLDLLIEGYPEDLRQQMEGLGPEFARAVLDLDDGRPDVALPALLGLDADHPLVCWETARAAHALGDAAAAARTLRRFPELAGGHREMGRLHSGVLLAQLLAESDDLPGALRVLRDLRATEPDAGGFLYAQLLASAGELAEAEEVVRGLIRDNGRYLPLYSLLARIRLLGGFRVEAMAALEKAMAQTCGSPGKCGYMPPDPAIVRQLAILYLEDGMERDRAMELAAQARSMAAKPGWEDLYLAALVARVNQAPGASELAEQVWSHVGDGDPRRSHLERYLPLPV